MGWGMTNENMKNEKWKMENLRATLLKLVQEKLDRQECLSYLQPESASVLAGYQERPDHFGALDAAQRYVVIAHVLTRQGKLIHFGKPEIVTGKVVVRRVISIPAQVAEILCQDKRDGC
jgi:hypothetical protein